MISPINGDGSISGDAINGGKGEWIELYNPDICEPVDISCYYLGNTTPAGLSEDHGGFILPQGTIVPPGGFCLVRGANAPAVPSNLLVENGGNVVEVVVPPNITDEGICVEGGGILGSPSRFWFPNTLGWFAFYDRDGVPQDAVSWGGGNATPGNPCVPTVNGCNNSVTSLPSYANIPNDRKTKIYSSGVNDGWEKTIRRIPDGGDWVINVGADATYATCNDECAQLGSSTCSGTATVNPTGGTAPYTYVWSDSEGQLTQTATGLCEGTYQVVVTDANGISETFSVDIENLELDVSAIAQDADCGVDNGEIAISSANGQNPFNYSVDNGGNYVSNSTITGLASGVYNIVVKDDNGCTGNTSTNIGSLGGPDVSAPADVTICVGEGVVLEAQNPDGGTITWSNGVTDGDEVFPTETTTYTVTSTIAGCDASDQITVTVQDPANPVFSADITEGCSPLKVTFTNDAGVSSGTTCLWDFGDGETSTNCGPVSHTYTDGGDYTVTLTITTSVGCTASTTIADYITVIDGPDAQFSANPTETVIPNTEIIFTNNSSNADGYIWDFGDGSPYVNEENTSHIYSIDEAGEYTVTLYANKGNCIDSAKVKINIKLPGVEYEMPNVFTPNGDGNNDLFHFVYRENIKEFLEVVVVNRWGNVVYESSNIDFTWNGKVNNSGAECSEGTYFYIIRLKNYDDEEIEDHGFVQLIRGKK